MINFIKPFYITVQTLTSKHHLALLKTDLTQIQTQTQTLNVMQNQNTVTAYL